MIPVLSMCRAPRRLILVFACLGGTLTGPVIHAQTPDRPGEAALRIGTMVVLPTSYAILFRVKEETAK